MEEHPEPEPRRIDSRVLREIAIYAYSSVLVLYALACGWLAFSTMNGELSRTGSVSGIIALGLLYPVCSLSMRQAVLLQSKQTTNREPGIFSLITWRPRPGLQRVIPRAIRGTSDQGVRAPMSRDRANDVGLAIISAALFWAFWAGSLVAALVVPITVHWMLRRRA